MRRVHGFGAITPDNDPYSEHDFGRFDFAGNTIFWKIDCYDRALKWGSPDQAAAVVTVRVLTVMVVEKY